MRFLTGKDRVEYERTIVAAAEAVARKDAAEREVARLERRVEDLKADWMYEREKADRAADALLASKGLPTIMPERQAQPDLVDDPYASEDPKEVEKMLKAMGLERKHAEA